VFDRRGIIVGAGAMLAGGALPAWARGLAHYPAPTREAMVPVPGGRVYVRVNGDLAGPKPPVVFVHGGPGGTHAAYLEALTLVPERGVILYDQLDSGRSDWPENPANWTVARFVDELDAIRTALGVARWHVCGHSWGGTIALEYGARHAGRTGPPVLASLTLASPLISTRSWIADADALRTKLPPKTQASLKACDSGAPPKATVCETATSAFYAAFNGREPASVARRDYERTRSGRGFNARLYQTMWGASEFVATGSLKEYDGEPLLAKLDGRRTLMIVGQYDEARPVTAAGFAERIPGAEFAVVPGAAHGIFGDRPEETIALLRGWLDRQDAA